MKDINIYTYIYIHSIYGIWMKVAVFSKYFLPKALYKNGKSVKVENSQIKK